MKSNKKGFTLVEIMIVVAIIALLAAIAIPSFMKSRQDSRRSACINNLRLLDHAKQQLATSSQTMLDSTIPVMADIMPYLKGGGTSPRCRDGGSYTVNAITSNPTCDKSGSPWLHIMQIDVN